MAKFRLKELEVITTLVSELYNKQQVENVKKHQEFIDVQDKANILLSERKEHFKSITHIDETIKEMADKLNKNLCENNDIVTIKYNGYSDNIDVDAYIYRIQKEIMYEAVKASDDPDVKSLQQIEDRLMEKFISS
tara:strand:- start:336 stop:740 length:405 start_codon:yes stop_codon:yes gene_type:complete